MILNLAALAEAKVETEPFPYFCVPDFLGPDGVAKAIADFPQIAHGGLFPIDRLSGGGFFSQMIHEFISPEVAAVVGDKLGVALTDMATMLTVRGQARAKDGRVHTDATFKQATLLFYLNEDWPHAGGRLRLLRSDDLEDYAAEIPPLGGTLIGFRCTPHAWHGHAPFVGTRRYIMCNYVADRRMVRRELARHRLTARLKALKPAFLSR